MSRSIRNVAIIAHVDHGKTTLVDQLLAQSGQFGRGEQAGDCILDSNPLERERGITILSKNCAIDYVDRNGESFHINIIDTPGHADFSGEVERVLMMADGALLLVDAFEGVMPQTRYVLQKALERGLQPIVVINKMDRPEIRPDEVQTEVFEMLIDLGADDHAMDFPTLFASAKEGWAITDGTPIPAPGEGDVHDLFDAMISHVPAPICDASAPLQAMITTLDYSDYVGRIGIGRVYAGTLHAARDVALIDRDGKLVTQRTNQLYRFHGLGRKEVKAVEAGDLFAVVGLDAVDIGVTIADPEEPVALPSVKVDEPTLHMVFRFNDSPFAGTEGTFVTARQLKDRLHREIQTNVALKVEDRGDSFLVSGRGLLHLGILLETMRREGYELAVGRPRVIFRTIDGVQHEPMENLIIDVPVEHQGTAMGLVGDRKAELMAMEARGNRVKLELLIPSRGLIGLAGRMLTATQGQAIMHHRFHSYGPFKGPIGGRTASVMIATETGQATPYALDQLADRGIMFVAPGDKVYMGQVVGETPRPADIEVNVTRQKKLTNMRAAAKDTTVVLKVPRLLTLEAALEYIEDDELVEITPKSIRVRKLLLLESDRRREARKKTVATG